MTSRAVDDLRTELARLEKAADDKWVAGLEDRKIKELEFADQSRDREVVSKMDSDTFEKLHANKRYYSVAGLSREYAREWILRHAPSKVVLDYACGNGAFAIQAARAGAALSIGLDISRVSIENAKRDAGQAGMSANTYFLQGDCESTGLPDNSIDAVICSGMLHHLDLSYAFPELRRIMKPGAILLAIEALDYNPLIKAYRMLTPQMRTDWEKVHILSLRDVRFAKRFFQVKSIRYWHLFAIAAVVLRKTPLFNAGVVAGNLLDRVILRIPLLKQMAWMFTFELEKPR